MRSRCNNPKHANYDYYGGRGIRVCARWNKYDAFAQDMGECPSDAHSIDRIDNSGNYEPGNCKWSTKEEQSVNKRTFLPVKPGAHKHILLRDVNYDLHKGLRLAALKRGITMRQYILNTLSASME